MSLRMKLSELLYVYSLSGVWIVNIKISTTIMPNVENCQLGHILCTSHTLNMPCMCSKKSFSTLKKEKTLIKE